MSKKLWEKGYKVDPMIERFTVGKDYKTDMRIIGYDIKASIVHAEMLCKMGYLSQKELKEIKKTFEELLNLVNDGKFVIKPKDEDCHTAIENFLIQRIGKAGKKIHTARSRNDQVLTALRLFYKDELESIEQLLRRLQEVIKNFSIKYGHVQFAGFTHTRKAMPSDFKTWGEALYDSLEDDLKLLKTVYEIIDQSPLGTGAGYGIPIKIDREFTAKELGFSKIQKNPIYSQNSRGKFDYLILHVLSQISYDLNKVSSDIIFFSLPEVGYLNLPKELCTGSSIMPQKLNPDPLELVRGYHNKIVARMIESIMVSSNLISGYHRDFQLLKENVIECFDIVKDLIEVIRIVFEKMSVNEENCKKSITEEVLATQKVYELVKKGIPFRDAYRKIAQSYGGEKE